MKQIQRIPITNSPVYLMNNLTSSNLFVAFLTYTQEKMKVNLLNRKTKEVNQIQIQDNSIPTSIQYLHNNILIVTTSTGYYIYSENGQEQYHKLRNQLDDNLQYFIGAAYVTPESSKPFYAIGYENKIIFVDSEKNKTEIFGIQLKDIRPTCITSIFQYLIYGDDKGIDMYYLGCIYTNKCISFSSVTEYKQLDLQTKNTSIVSIKAMEIKSTSQILAVAADFIGRITIVDLKEWTIQSVINAHIKPITGLAINQKQEQIISASDDTFVNIWKMNNKEQPQLVISQHLEDTVITGVTSDIYIAAYDQYELIYLDMSSERIYQFVNNDEENVEDADGKKNNFKRYKSKHPGNLPPSYSTFNTKNTTLQINNINGNQILHKGYLKHHALWGKPKNFEVTDELMFPIGIVKPEQCQDKKPQVWKHYKYHADVDKFKTYLLSKPRRPQTSDGKPKQIDFLKKETFGKIPSYLEKMKNEKLEKQREEEEELRRKKKEKDEQKVNKNDVYKVLQQLLAKKSELLKEFAQYSHKRDMTQQTKLKKEDLEKQLNQLDKDIKKLERLYNR